MTQKEYLVKTTFDNAGLDQAQIDFKNMQAAAKALGYEMSETAKIIDQKVMTSLSALGGTMRSVATTVQQDGKNIRIAFTEAQGGISNVSGAMTSAGAASEGMAGKLGELVTRALPTIVVWEAFRAALHGVEQLFQESIKFMIEWETEMAKVRSVTGATKEQIDIFSASILQVSEKFAVNAKDVATASNEWLRMGATMENIVPLLEATSKLSVLSGQSMSDSAKAINSIVSAFGLSASEAGTAVDKLIAIEEKSHVSLDVLTSGFAKAGLTAKAMGLSFDELAGYITAVNEKSRQSGDLIGTQLRSMFIRLGTTAVDTAQAIAQVPFYLDAMGKVTTTHTATLRNLNDIIKELAEAWGGLSNAQQDALAKTLGGNLRSTAVIALLSNFSEALKASGESAKASGEAQEALSTRLDTVDSKVKQLQTSWGQFSNSVNASGIIKTFLDNVKERVNLVTFAVNGLHLAWDLAFNRDALNKRVAAFKAAQEAQKTAAKKPLETVSNADDEDIVQTKITTTLLTQDQIKQQIEVLEKNAIVNRTSALDLALQEQAIIAKGDGLAEKALDGLRKSTDEKVLRLQIEDQITKALENQTTIEAQMKAEGASALQIDIQRLGFLQATHALQADIDKQQEKVNVAGIEQYKGVQDQIVTALLSEQKALGETTLQQIENKINLQDQLGIHLQGLDLLKQQLDLYKAINEESNKTPAQRRGDLEKQIAIHNRQKESVGGNGAQDEIANSFASFRASMAGLSQKTIDSVLHPEKANGGVNSLQDELRRGLTNPLNVNISRLSVAIDRLAEGITNPRAGGNRWESARPPHLPTGPGVFPPAGQQRYSNSQEGVAREFKIDIGGIHVTMTAHNKQELAEEVKKELTDLIAAHLAKPGTKISQAAQKAMNDF